MTASPSPSTADERPPERQPAGADAPPAFGTFFLPGPTEVRPEVLAAMTQPMIAHRGPRFEALFERLQEGLRAVFRTTRPVYVSSSSATGMMEAALRCTAPAPVLAIVTGAFSERFAQIARACGREVVTHDVPWGRAADPGDVARRLAAGVPGGGRFGAVTVVHSETSTAALTDVRAVQEAARAHGAWCLVDSVTGVGGAPLAFDVEGYDFVLTGSQKALAMPPGLAFAVASERFARAMREVPARGLYFDLVEFDEFAAKRQTPNTPALSLLYAADVQLARITAEGIEARWARHAEMATLTHTWAGERAVAYGLGVLCPPGERSPTVTALTVPHGTATDAIVRGVAERGFVIGGGYGKLKATTLRIGHMGDHDLHGLRRCLAALEETLRAS